MTDRRFYRSDDRDLEGHDLGPEVVARAIEAAQDERGRVDGARVFGGEV